MADGTIGTRLRALRRQHGLTQYELAEKASVSIDTIRSLEQGRGGVPQTRTLARLGGVLGVGLDELLGSPVPGDPVQRSARDERDREFGARIRQLLAACRMTPGELEAVLSAGMPGVPRGKRATLADQVAFMAAELRTLRADVAAMAPPELEDS